MLRSAGGPGQGPEARMPARERPACAFICGPGGGARSACRGATPGRPRPHKASSSSSLSLPSALQALAEAIDRLADRLAGLARLPRDLLVAALGLQVLVPESPAQLLLRLAGLRLRLAGAHRRARCSA